MNLTGGSSNIVCRNHFGGNYATASSSYVSGGSDIWTGNWSMDRAETEVEAISGSTSRVPAAE